MASVGLQLQQRAELAVTADLRQAIAMLALSALEVQQLVAQEVGDNPCLEYETGSDDADFAVQDAAAGRAEGGWEVHDDAADGALGRMYDAGARGAAQDEEGADGWLNRVPPAEETLQAHLQRQFDAIVPAHTPEGLKLRVAGFYIIENIDEAGYLRLDIPAAARRLGLPEDVLDDARAIVQTLEPVGVGARDLAECLRLQLHARGQLEAVMETVLNHLDKVAAQDWATLARLGKTDPEEIRLAVAELRHCNPKPASAFGGNVRVEAVVPDVVVSRAEETQESEEGALKGWRVALNGAAFPKLLAYTPKDLARLHEAKGGKAVEEGKKYLQERLGRAKWLMGALEQRAATTLAVAKAALSRQRAFLDAGAEFLQPLTLRDVAGAVGVHESTVSRVVSGKYMQTPWGVLPLKILFASGVASSGGQVGVAAPSVQRMIKRLVDAENPAKPLSDEQIVAALKAEGVDLARRTVAKYRGILGIPGTAERRVRWAG